MNKRKFLTVVSALLIVAVGISVNLVGSASGSPTMNRASLRCAKTGFDVNFWRKQVDPIVSFGVPVSAHMHDYFGTYDISSVGVTSQQEMDASIAKGHPEDPGYNPRGTNCPFYGDWAKYWFPTAKFNGTNILPSVLTNTWQAPVNLVVATPPFGMTYVAGDSHALTELGISDHVRFTCGNIDGPFYTHPTDCTPISGGVVTAQVTFPDCWDGTTAFDGTVGIDPKHFSYSVNGACMPGQVPCVPGTRIAQLVTQQTFVDPRTNLPMVNPNLTGTTTNGLTFSSGEPFTYHGDFHNLWNHYLGDIVTTCLNNAVPCPYGTKIGLHYLE